MRFILALVFGLLSMSLTTPSRAQVPPDFIQQYPRIRVQAKQPTSLTLKNGERLSFTTGQTRLIESSALSAFPSPTQFVYVSPTPNAMNPYLTAGLFPVTPPVVTPPGGGVTIASGTLRFSSPKNSGLLSVF